jgi:hypothetical protein
MRDEAAGLLEPCGQYGHFPMSLFCSFSERRADEGVLNDQKFFSFFHRPHEYSVCFAARRPERE